MSSADKRTAHTDAGDTLGTIIGPHEKRDAIHLAVEPMQAGQELEPGARVIIGTDRKLYNEWEWRKADVPSGTKPIGIVDPFIEGTVYRNQWVWLVLMPRTIRSLRHVWEHPQFPSALPEVIRDKGEAVDPEKLHKTLLLIEEPNAVAVQTIRNVANTLGVEYDDLIERAKDYVNHGEYWIEGGRFEGEYIPEDFWPAFTQVTGIKVPEQDQSSFLSCSC